MISESDYKGLGSQVGAEKTWEPIPTKQSSLSHNTIVEVGEIREGAAGLANLEDSIKERLK